MTETTETTISCTHQSDGYQTDIHQTTDDKQMVKLSINETDLKRLYSLVSKKKTEQITCSISEVQANTTPFRNGVYQLTVFDHDKTSYNIPLQQSYGDQAVVPTDFVVSFRWSILATVAKEKKVSDISVEFLVPSHLVASDQPNQVDQAGICVETRSGTAILSYTQSLVRRSISFEFRSIFFYNS